jgi:hypothetical protein
MIILIEVEVEKTEGKFVSKDELVEAIENELGGAVDVDESHYEISSMSLHACPKPKPKAKTRDNFPGFRALDAIGDRAFEIETARREAEAHGHPERPATEFIR